MEWPEFHGIVGEDPAMTHVFDLIEMMAPHDEPVVITGEMGTGRGLVARAIHQLSPRCSNTFLGFTCSASCIDRTLFGHEKGAFPGAYESRKGIFEAHDKGTVFLDEIDELPMGIQSSILRMVEYGKIRPVGRTDEVDVDTRVIAGTYNSPADMVEEGRLKESLSHFIAPFQIPVPPLRERPADIPLLARYFLHLLNKRTSKKKVLSDASLEKLCNFKYPGNVRELDSIIRRAAFTGKVDMIDEDLIVFSPVSLSDKVANL